MRILLVIIRIISPDTENLKKLASLFMNLLLENDLAKEIEKLKKNTVFYSQKTVIDDKGNKIIITGKSLSRLMLFHSGANRLICKSDNSLPIREQIRKDEDITSFSYGSRKRYFEYVNSLNLDSFPTVFIITNTFTTEIKEILNRENLRYIMKIWFKRLVKLGYDYVYKLEYTEKEMPHLHIFIYTKQTYRFKDDSQRIEECIKLGARWVNTVFRCTGLRFFRNSSVPLLKIYKNMLKVNCHSDSLEVPEDIKKKVFYLAYYFSRQKEYQNKIPEKYYGLKMWGYGRENYGSIKVDPIEIPITQSMYYDMFNDVQALAKEKKMKECKEHGKYCSDCIRNNPSEDEKDENGKRIMKCGLYRKNGIFLQDPIRELNKLKKHEKYEKMLTDDQFLEISLDLSNKHSIKYEQIKDDQLMTKQLERLF